MSTQPRGTPAYAAYPDACNYIIGVNIYNGFIGFLTRNSVTRVYFTTLTLRLCEVSLEATQTADGVLTIQLRIESHTVIESELRIYVSNDTT
jgi:hypothetical protein